MPALLWLLTFSLQLDPAALRAGASVYPAPEYPAASVRAQHTGRVVVDVVVAPLTKTSPLARVQSSKVVQAPDQALANAVLAVLKDARFMPFFDDRGVARASGTVIWEFRFVGGQPQVIDPYAPPRRAPETPRQIALEDLRIVRRARRILSSEAVWNRRDNRQCPPKSNTVSLYCALERATLEVAGTFDHRGHVMEDARSALADVTPHHPDYPHWLMDYNNDPSTTFADIQKVLDATLLRIRRRIEF